MEPNDSEQDEYLFTMREDPVLSLTALHQSEALQPALRVLQWQICESYANRLHQHPNSTITVPRGGEVEKTTDKSNREVEYSPEDIQN